MQRETPLLGLPRAHALAFAVAALLIAAFTGLHLRTDYGQIMAYWQGRQSGIADVRARMVSNWLNERRTDAEVLAALPSLDILLSAPSPRRVAAPAPAELTRQIASLFDRFTAAYGYTDIYLVDVENRVRIRSPVSPEISPQIQEISRLVLQRGKFRISFLGDSPSTSLISFAMPVVLGGKSETAQNSAPSVRAAIILQISPEKALFPLLTTDSVPSETGETLLVVREGNDIVCRSPLRHLPAGGKYMRWPIQGSSLPAAAALLKGETYGEFVDYRGERVLAAMHRIPEAEWVLVRKVDRQEAMAEFRNRAWLEVLAAALLLVAALGFLRGHQRKLKAHLLQNELQQQRNILNLKAHAQTIVDNVPAGLLMLTSDLRILSANRWFLERFGLKSEEVIGRMVHEVLEVKGPPFRVSGASSGSPEPHDVLVEVGVASQEKTQTARITIREAEQEIQGGELVFVVEDLTESERLRATAEASQRRLGDLVQSVDAIVWEADPATGQFTFVSQKTEQILGYPAEEWLQDANFWARHLHPDDRAAVVSHRRAAAQGQGQTLEYRMLAADGRWVWLQDQVRVFHDASGAARELRGLIVDITASKNAEEELRRVNRALRTLSECNQALVHATSEQGFLHDLCQALVAVGGYRFAWVGFGEMDAERSVRPVAQAGFEDGYLSSNPATWAPTEQGRDPAGTAIRTGRPCVVRNIETDPNFQLRRAEALRRGYASLAGIPLKSETGPRGVLCVYAAEPDAFGEEEVRLLTELAGDLVYGIQSLRTREEHEQAEEAIRRSEASLAEAQRIAHLGNWEWDVRTDQAWWSEEMYRIFGQDPSKFKPRLDNSLKCIHPEDRAAVEASLRESLGSGKPYSIDYRIERPDGSERYVHAEGEASFDETRKQLRMVGIVQDITEQKRAEEALRRSETNYRSLILGATYGIFRCNVRGEFLDANPALATMLGYESNKELLRSEGLQTVFQAAEEGAQLLSQFRQAGRVDGVEVTWRRKDGALVPVRLSGRAVLDEQGVLQGFEVITENIVERRQLEEQLRQAQKMEAVGRLAGGVAHDFNNLLTIINGYSQLLRERLEPESPLHAHLEEIQNAGDRATSLTRQLLAFSRRQVLQPQVLNLNTVVKNMEKMLGRLIGEDVELKFSLAANLGLTRADPGQIEQVIMNLAVNARDAMPQGGQLTISTENVSLDRTYIRKHVVTTPGPHVMLGVSDTGCGMDEETQRHIFEPFFTTKEHGRGTGLGLAMVYGIVKQSGGNIWVYSEPGKGTTFKIYLPRVEEVVAEPQPREASRLHHRGSETVLVVEDDEAVRTLVQGVLRSNGYTVLTASDPEEASALCQRHQGPIHLLLSDVIMPKTSGRRLYEHLAFIRPDMKVLYMSGYTDDAIVHHGVLEKGIPFLQKPFTPEGLARKVREVLDR